MSAPLLFGALKEANNTAAATARISTAAIASSASSRRSQGLGSTSVIFSTGLGSGSRGREGRTLEHRAQTQHGPLLVAAAEGARQIALAARDGGWRLAR